MKKYLLIGFVLGAVIFGSITGVVAYNFSAKSVSYTPKDTNWKVDNVESAINDLKDEKNIFDYSNVKFGDSQLNYTYGNAEQKTTQLELEAGTYIVSLVVADAFGSSNSNITNQSDVDSSFTFTCDNSLCNYKKINSRVIGYRSNDTAVRNEAFNILLLVNITSKTTITSSFDPRSSNVNAHSVSMFMNANKIN